MESDGIVEAVHQDACPTCLTVKDAIAVVINRGNEWGVTRVAVYVAMMFVGVEVAESVVLFSSIHAIL